MQNNWLNSKIINQDLDELRSSTLKLIERRAVEIDFRSIIEPNLKQLGYPYTLESNYRNHSKLFDIHVAPGCMLTGHLNHCDYPTYISLQVKISHGEYFGETKSPINLPIGDWTFYMPFLEKLVTRVNELKEKYDYRAKTMMKSSMLGLSLVKPYINKIGLENVTLEVAENMGVIMKMQIVNNASLRTLLTIDNYKQHCDDFVSIAKSLHVFTKPGIRRGVEFECGGFRDIVSKNSGPWRACDVKMTYLDVFPEYGDFSQDKKRIGATIYKCLSDLGYIFYVENDNLHVVLNKDISLIRSLSTKYTYFSYKKETLEGRKMKVKDKTLFHLLQMTAAASVKTGYDFDVRSTYHYYTDIPFLDNLYFYFERLLPYNTSWNNVQTRSVKYWRFGQESYHNGGIFHVMLAPDCYIKIRPTGGDTIDVIWEVMENWNEILKIKDIKYQFYLDDKDKEFSFNPT